MALAFLMDIFVFLLGLCVGSFLNCVIYRLEQKKSLRGRSFCPHCKQTLKWHDLIPVFSFLFLRSRCRYCERRISLQYPLVELATSIIFILIFWHFRFIWNLEFGIWNLLKLVFYFYIASSLIVIFVYDLKHYLIPDKILFPAIGITLVYRVFEFGIFAPLLNYIFAAFLASGFFFAIFLISAGRWMGFGDVKIAILLGFLLGLPNVFVALFLAFFSGAIIGITLMVLKKKNLKSEIPFGPFLIAGSFMAMLWGEKIIEWYLRIFNF